MLAVVTERHEEIGLKKGIRRGELDTRTHPAIVLKGEQFGHCLKLKMFL